MEQNGRLATPEGREIAWRRISGEGPGIVFLHGLRSDMGGTKAEWLAGWAAARGRAFLRFDVSGHGASSGTFEAGCIGDWAADARAAIAALTEGPQLIVGSSMGGWLALLLARDMPERVAGLVTIAAAPDFTEDGMWAGMSPDRRAELLREGRVEEPSNYGPPLVITRRLIEDGRDHLVLRRPLALPFPARFLHGTADADVPCDWGLRLLAHVTGEDVRLTLVKGADHRFSAPAELELIGRMVAEVAPG